MKLLNTVYRLSVELSGTDSSVRASECRVMEMLPQETIRHGKVSLLGQNLTERTAGVLLDRISLPSVI